MFAVKIGSAFDNTSYVTKVCTGEMPGPPLPRPPSSRLHLCSIFLSTSAIILLDSENNSNITTLKVPVNQNSIVCIPRLRTPCPCLAAPGSKYLTASAPGGGVGAGLRLLICDSLEHPILRRPVPGGLRLLTDRLLRLRPGAVPATSILSGSHRGSDSV